VNSYAKKVAELDYMVKRMVFGSYGLENEKCECLLESTDYVLRCYKYRTPEAGESNLGVHAHTDSGFLTILNQRLSGLEIQLKNGEWFQVDASPSTFAVLAGDAFAVMHFFLFLINNIKIVKYLTVNLKMFSHSLKEM